MSDPAVTAAERCYLHARELADRLELAEALGTAEPGLAEDAAASRARLLAALSAVDLDTDDVTRAAADRQAGCSVPPDTADRRAVEIMRRWVEAAGGDPAASVQHSQARPDAECEALRDTIERDYSARQAAVEHDGRTSTRLAVLGSLGDEPDPERRRRLFHALRPVWQSIDGDGDDSPYRRLLAHSARRWAHGSPVAANAAALGMAVSEVEPALVAILETWRVVTAGGPPIEPWDWWHTYGTTARALRAAVPLHRLRPLSDAYHAALGANPVELGVHYDVTARTDRPPVPVAYTTFGSRPRETAGGWTRAVPWVLGTYTAGGLGELTELIHETGHALHVAAIAARPAFADWPDSDALTEAIAELTALDTAEPAWQEHWLGVSVPARTALRDRYADVMLDVCWALFEIRLHADSARRPNDVWTELTSTYLGVTAHPELSWWAMRGQLVQEPGYMVNYALGPILAADLRAAVRAARGDWTTGDPGWYAWVSEHLYRFGLARSSGDVLRDLLGRPPSADALLAELYRAA
ncbi:hypothetical protein [Catellatospora citrea]|uniref:Oligoendopeptidase F n=1 Tax=Catellatospora citrea TaxID=53366 RepID=A0A8J3KTB7_9ACTN|nr:hypothetical protein [Catellatospora citrea]RKE02860.1 hypothetical protein C8E86_8169 [Catellatospora citrea]GIG01585.1 hypothetical protein Cci01nite_66780 [Catellatospora citrea]